MAPASICPTTTSRSKNLPRHELVEHMTNKVQEAMNRLEQSRTVCYDAETSGLDWKRNHIVGHVLSFGPRPQDSYYLPVRHKPGGNIGGHRGPQDSEGWDRELHPVEPDLIRLLDRPYMFVFGHNLAFDLKFLHGVGFKMQPHFEDTIINAPLIDEFQSSFKLEACAQIAKVTAKRSSEIADYIQQVLGRDGLIKRGTEMGHYWRLAGDDEMAVAYAEGDGMTTWQLLDWQRPKFSEVYRDPLIHNDPGHDMLDVHDIECRLIPILARMTIKGIKVDEERLDRLVSTIQKIVGEQLEDFPADFNPRAPTHVRQYLEKAGQTNWPKTARDDPSFTQDWLKTHESGQKLIAVRRFLTLMTTFIVPLRDTHLFNGRLHPEFIQLKNDDYGTITGRLASARPNIQAVPKRDKDIGRMYRSCFLPDYGNWGSVDFEQIEPRLLAFYSRVPALLDGFRAVPPIDPHQAVANATGMTREIGKRINQTLITGGGANALNTRYGMDLDEARRYMEQYFDNMPQVRTLQRDAAAVFERRGFVRSLLGRRARLKNINKSYVAVNRLLQCGNADIIKLKMVQVDDYLESEGRPEVDVLLNVHDALEYQFSDDARHHFDRCLEIMCEFGPDQPIHLDLPVTVDAGIGPDWGLATYGPEDV